MKVVVNTSPFVALDRIGQIGILPKLFGDVIRPQSVQAELQAGKDCYGGSDTVYDAPWCQTADDPEEMVLRKELGAGETAVIALAVRINADLVVLDDLAARSVAIELGLSVTGTLGLLVAAHKRGYLPAIDQAVAALQEAGFRVSQKLVTSVLDRPQ